MKVALVTEGTYPLTPAASPRGATSSCAACRSCGSRSWRCRGRVASPSRFTPAAERRGRAPGRPVGPAAARGRPFPGRTRRFVGRVRAAVRVGAARRPARRRSGSRRRCARCASSSRRRVADRGVAQPARRGGAARRLVAHAGAGTAADVTLTLADALAVTDLVEHFLRPLQLRRPKADLVHATANGPSMLVGLTAKWAAGHAGRCSPSTASTCANGCSRSVASGYPRAVRTVLVRFFHRLTELGYRSADAVLPVSDFNGRWARARRCARATGSAPCTTASTRGDLPAAGRRARRPTLVFAGRIDPLKDLDTLVRAFALVRGQVPARPAAALRRRAGGQRGLRGGDPPARRRPRASSGCRHVRGAGLAGVAGVRGRARRRACPACRRGCR